MSVLFEGSGAPPPGDTHSNESRPTLIGPKVVASTTTMLALALTVYSTRIYARWRSYQKLGLDDFTISIAMALATAGYGILLRLYTLLDGLHVSQLELKEIMMILKLSFMISPLWVWTVAMVKISILFMLLRIKQTPKWKWGVGGLIILITLTTIAIMVTQLVQCNPISANWNPMLQQTNCWTPERVLHVNYGVSSLFVLTDFICALLPLAFIWKINRPLREKVVLALLLGLGLIAGVCGVVKLAMLRLVLNSHDPTFDSADLSIWAFAEMFVGIIAACIPCLKSLMEKAYRALGGSITRSATKGQSEYFHGTRSGVHDGSLTYNMQTLRSSKQIQVDRKVTILHSQSSDDDVPFAYATVTAERRSTPQDV
ncbi:hypothetical protein P152DRAFT_456888 [Eremomyces bilateralis CBS 781.70]|uniref:Rhodopsin domain-containing protein n=1 Tax=Eremomyces bilateralis CBS 781.70 TaxID=1392243 RepID=A0A6G1G9B9_9PEZI|nr:uncharacterized protein P152DRAFT_456888 [Eremomyces bilateralis CBS 781.70]KAF1814613.1 hypothetical protein P152DRAFT_456888 [Eremomyces bilateralis CBS 781.70]